MYTEGSKGPFCQSCGMPMRHASDFGMGADGLRINDFCRFCFDRGSFSDPDMTEQAMIDRCVGFMARQTFTPEFEARRVMRRVIPTLKRWSSAPVGSPCLMPDVPQDGKE